MEIIKNTYEIKVTKQVEKYFTDTAMFFDIECLGLSAKYNEVYLIGYSIRNGNTVTEVQIFANKASDEPEVLREFCKAMEGYDTLISFNGIRFDEPFLIDRMEKYGIAHPFNGVNHIDLYRKCCKARDILNLPNYKQKTFEQFLGFYREDEYDGGKLIQVFKDYEKTQDEGLRELLLLHNYEDVLHMTDLLEATSYVDLMEHNVCFEMVDKSDDADALRYTFRCDITVPVAVSVKKEFGTLVVSKNHLALTLTKNKELLYTYLKNFKDYYYLPSENQLIPVQLASGVDKSDMVKATKETARIPFEGEFVRIPFGMKDEAGRNIFKKEYADKQIYVRCSEVDDDFAERLLRTFL